MALLAGKGLDAVERPACGRLLAAERASDRERLAGDDAEHGVPLVHGERVEDPGHHLPVGADVGRGDVPLRADVVDDLARVPAGEALELALRESLRVTDDAALRPAEGEAHQGALPGHPHRERLHLVERDVGVVADAALGRPARDVVRHAEALEHADRAVVHRDRDRDLDGLLALGEDADEVRVEREDLADPGELRLRESERVLPEVGFRPGC